MVEKNSGSGKYFKGAAWCAELSGCHIAGMLRVVPRISQALVGLMPCLQSSEGEKCPLRCNK